VLGPVPGRYFNYSVIILSENAWPRATRTSAEHRCYCLPRFVLIIARLSKNGFFS
jgi:hypothetical protein